MERTIRVTGKGRLKIRPDMIRLTIKLEGRSKEYGEALELSAEQTGELKEVFERLGFDRDDLKTLSFDADTEYESYKDKDENRRRRLTGYSFCHRLKIEFDEDSRLLGRILYELAHSSLSPEFRIDYTVKDTEALKNELLSRAVSDSRQKAEVLCKAAGVSLSGVEHIDYSWGEIEFVSTFMDRMAESRMTACSSMESYDIDVNPDDIDVYDTVTIVWSIL